MPVKIKEKVMVTFLVWVSLVLIGVGVMLWYAMIVDLGLAGLLFGMLYPGILMVFGPFLMWLMRDDLFEWKNR